MTSQQSQNIEFVAAALDRRKIDISLCNAVTWHGILIDQGLVSNKYEHLLLDIACSVCDMVNVKWSIDQDAVDFVEAVNLGAKGVYASLIGTLVIILHKHKAELQLINYAHVRLNAYSDLSVIICRSLHQDSSEEEFSEQNLPAHCAPAIVVMSQIGQQNGSWSPAPTNPQQQLMKMCPHYENLKYQVNMSNADAATWAGFNDSLPILMVEMAQACTLVEHSIIGDKEDHDYVREFCGCYRRVVTTLARNGMTRGMTLREIVRSSLRAAKAYSRSSTDCAAQRENIHKRMEVATSQNLGTRLVDYMNKISAQSDGWTNDTARDFTSTEWTNLEQIGGTSFMEAEVSLAEDLESADQMRGARAALQECANDTADHVGLLIQVMEQLANHKLAMDKWKAEHGHHQWFTLIE